MNQTPSPEEAREALGAVRHEVAKAVVGQDAAVSGLLVALLSRGHVLMEGVPGVAKTLLVRSLAAALDVDTRRVQFTPDLMPGDITGSMVIESGASGGHELTFREGPVFTNLLLADEINRTPPKTQSALLEAMEEGQVSADGRTRPLPRPFLVAATQNPVEYEGTYPLPEAQLDRFLLKVHLPLPERDDELTDHAPPRRRLRPARHRRRRRHTPSPDRSTSRPASVGAEQVRVSDEVAGYVVDLARATRQAPSLSLGVSPRGATALLRSARAWAWLNGRDFATPDDVKALAHAALAHRLALRPEAELDGRRRRPGARHRARLGAGPALRSRPDDAHLAGPRAGAARHRPAAAAPDRRASAWAWVGLVLLLVLADVVLAPSRTALSVVRREVGRARQGEHASSTPRARLVRAPPAARPAPRRLAALGGRHRQPAPPRPRTGWPAGADDRPAARRGAATCGPTASPCAPSARSGSPAGSAATWSPACCACCRRSPRCEHLPSRLARLRELDGRAAVRVRGQGTEFDSLREYVDGDDVRSVDWRASARTRSVVVRTWQPERDRRVFLVLDTGRTSAGRVDDVPRLDSAMDAGLLLTALAARAGDQVAMVAGDLAVRSRLRPGHRRDVVEDVQQAMAGLTPVLAETNWRALVGAVDALGRQRALVVLLTPLEPSAISSGLLPLLAPLTARHRVLLASVRDPELAAAGPRARRRPFDVRRRGRGAGDRPARAHRPPARRPRRRGDRRRRRPAPRPPRRPLPRPQGARVALTRRTGATRVAVSYGGRPCCLPAQGATCPRRQDPLPP